MLHGCSLQQEEPPKSLGRRLFKAYQRNILISADNPLRLGYFKSDLHVRREQERHLKVNRYAIHPFSRFRGTYELYLIVMYTAALFFKPMHVFQTEMHLKSDNAFRYVEHLINTLCWGDIIMTFFTGFTKKTHDTNIVELKFSNITRHYVLGPYFICDVLSSVPKPICYYLVGQQYNTYINFFVAVDICMFLKIVRLVPLLHMIHRATRFLQIKSRTGPFLACTLLSTLMVIHWISCLQYGVPSVALNYSSEERMTMSWIYQYNVKDRNFFQKYLHSFFKSSAYILAIRQPAYNVILAEEYIIAFFTYFIGKLLVAAIWLILAVSILNSRSIEIKFLELINQLEEYMRRKMLPLSLRERILDYYHFMYQRKYFKESFINNSLSGNVKKDMSLHICRNMIKNVSIFSDLTNEEISSIVEFLVPIIFLPQDTIIQYGTYGDAMYFLSTGTVAVYTRSGKEICHLQDGAYFGEISLLLPDQPRNASIIAIETSLVYRLNKKDFGRSLLNNKKMLDKITKEAQDRLHQTTIIEEEYKKYLFEQSLKATRFSTSQ